MKSTGHGPGMARRRQSGGSAMPMMGEPEMMGGAKKAAKKGAKKAKKGSKPAHKSY